MESQGVVVGDVIGAQGAALEPLLEGRAVSDGPLYPRYKAPLVRTDWAEWRRTSRTVSALCLPSPGTKSNKRHSPFLPL